jgi:hypothetical protein
MIILVIGLFLNKLFSSEYLPPRYELNLFPEKISNEILKINLKFL